MMSRHWIAPPAWAAAATTAVLLTAAHPSVSWAADHRDGPAAKADASTDINDVFAWMSPDRTQLNLILTVFPLATSAAKFSNAAKYVFHINSMASYGKPATEVRIVCTFDVMQIASCWLA